MYDAIVVGARCGGAAAALLLARRGHRVLLVDRATFPSDVVCTHHLSVGAAALLGRWGLLEDAVRSCPPSDRISVETGRGTAEVANPLVGTTNLTYAPRRHVLDAALVQGARRAGAHLCQGFTVRDLVWDGERVIGVVVQGPGGRSVCETARVIVGADGRQSLVARTVAAPTLEARTATACCYYAYWAGLDAPLPEWHVAGDHLVGVIPTGGGHAAVVARAPIGEWVTFKRSPGDVYGAVVARFPGLEARLATARRESRFHGTADLGGAVRRSAGPGWVLVGDAAHHDDPLVWAGIGAAFVDAELAAATVDEGLSGRMRLSEALEHHHHRWTATWAEARAAVRDWQARLPREDRWPAALHHVQEAAASSVRPLLVS